MSNNWKVEPSTITFFEKVLREHRKVATFQRTRDILFSLSLIDGREMRVLLVNVYTLGLADVIEARNEFPELNHVVTASAWNSYQSTGCRYADACRAVGVYEGVIGMLGLTSTVRAPIGWEDE